MRIECAAGGGQTADGYFFYNWSHCPRNPTAKLALGQVWRVAKRLKLINSLRLEFSGRKYPKKLQGGHSAELGQGTRVCIRLANFCILPSDFCLLLRLHRDIHIHLHGIRLGLIIRGRSPNSQFHVHVHVRLQRY